MSKGDAMSSKKTTVLAILILALAATPIVAAGHEQTIEEVLTEAYVEGIWRQRDPDLVRAGFAPTFVMQVYWKGELSSRTLDEWLERMKLDKKPRESEVRAEIEVLEVTGVAGLARVQLFEDGEHKYTDYFGLYQTGEGWKIVSKMFHAW